MLLMKILGLLYLALFSLTALIAPAMGEPAIPETPAGQAFSAWLTSFNSADAAHVAAFKKKFQRKGGVEEVLRWRKATGGFELLRIEESRPDLLRVLLKERDSDRASHFKLSRTGDGMGDNLIMEIRDVSLPPEFAPQRLTQTDALAALTARADWLTQQDRFSGAFLVARRGEILLQKSWGHANRESKAPVMLDTQFRLGSLNKMFTAVAILQLVESGKLSLDAALGQYLPDYPNKDVASMVTVRHLLSHTGGTGDIFGPEFERNRDQLKEHDDYLKLFGQRGPEFEPGTEDRYSNYGYVLLGALIEKVSGMSYYDYMRREVYAPAGMSSTDSLPETQEVPKRAAGYMREKGTWVRNDGTLPYRGMAAGGGYSTVDDLLRFAEALQAGKLISMNSVAEMTTPQDIGKASGYGFGIQGEGSLLHYTASGGAPGMNGMLSIFPQLGYVLVCLSNLDPPAADNMVEYFSVRMPVMQ
jgi:CubicO group peptidase (beta-lactamase class C family)